MLWLEPKYIIILKLRYYSTTPYFTSLIDSYVVVSKLCMYFKKITSMATYTIGNITPVVSTSLVYVYRSSSLRIYPFSHVYYYKLGRHCQTVIGCRRQRWCTKCQWRHCTDEGNWKFSEVNCKTIAWTRVSTVVIPFRKADINVPYNVN